LFARHVPHPPGKASPIENQNALGCEADASVSDGFTPRLG